MKFYRCAILLPMFLVVSCSNQVEDAVEVSEFHLKSMKRVERESRVVRAEQMKRLRGAVSAKEQRERKGHYYTVSWKLGESGGVDPVRVVLLYQQAGTGAKVLKREQVFAANQTKGKCEFAIIGEPYQKNGRVLSWRTELYSGANLRASEQSYLWE
ncbi:hypothetical protein [Rubritalea tangerina]|uniref:Lipoprotein n=1 Tax=Rubritalea tangerina TaxID=430798 RepID=A0ABW4Z9C9_9BACT